MGRSSTPMALDRTSAAPPALGRFYHCYIAWQRSVPLSRSKEAIPQAIRWLLTGRSLLSLSEILSAWREGPNRAIKSDARAGESAQMDVPGPVPVEEFA